MTGSPYRVPLAGDADPRAIVARLDHAPGHGALWGTWFGGGLVLVREPMTLVEPATAADGFAALDAPPPAAADDFTGVGGGWLVCAGYDPDSSVFAFHDSLLRWTEDAGWVFESLGLAGRQTHDRVALAHWTALLAGTGDAPPVDLGPFTTRRGAVATRDGHLAAVEDAIGRIGRGDFYQVNLCTRLHAVTTSRPAEIFAVMADRLRPAYGALVCGSGRSVAGFSPELFLRVRGDRVTTAPIKGTAPRLDAATDSPQLRVSAKDAAENVMIVDLMRNDLSRVCRPGTVAVPDLLGVEPHPGVWHLVSTVTGLLRPGIGAAALLAATFPPGSVTGAPKHAAVRAIGELEPEPRGAYTGAVGFVSPYAGAEWNVIIRSLELSGDGRVELGVGGGITVDSVPIREWYECLHKAAPLVAAAGSTLDAGLRDEPGPPPAALVAHGVFESVLIASGRPLRLAAHLARLDRSCRELFGAGLPDDLAASIATRLATMAPLPRRALRVEARPADSGLAITLSVRDLGPRLTTCALARADRNAYAWRHKWLDRDDLTAAEAASAPALPYFVGDAGVTETSRGNLFLLGSDGVWRTPPLDEQLLPGVTRRAVLDLAPELGIEVRVERVLPASVRAAFWTSSLSGAVAVTHWDGRPVTPVDAVVTALNEALGTS